jgi:thioredoxin reductase (NADPH)
VIYDTVIIGAGPAGLTAAIYALRGKLNAINIEDPGVMSQAGYAAIIENFPGFPNGISGIELISNFKKQVSILGGAIIQGGVKAISSCGEQGRSMWRISSDKGEYKGLSVIVASGAVAKRLGVKGEAEFSGKGVSYCAVCDGIFFKDKHIAVVGGGDSALEEALFLSRFAKRLTIIHRRDKLRAVKLLQDRVFSSSKIDIAWDSVVDEISGSSKVEKIRIRDIRSGSLSEIGCEGVFVSIGKSPNTGFLKTVLDIDENGYIITDKGLKTSVCGVFACGDCRDTLFRQVITACGDGALSAGSCIGYVDSMKYA